MKILLSTFLLLFSLAVSANETPNNENGQHPGCNWGLLTSADTSELGSHASDPSDDGHGMEDADRPRAGLANVVNKGSLQLTCELIRDFFNGD